MKSDQFEKPLYDLFMQAPAAIAVLKGPRHRFEFANPMYLELVDKSESVLGQTVRQAFPELKSQGFYELLDQVYRTGKKFVGTEMPALLKRGSPPTLQKLRLNFVFEPMKQSDGSVVGIMIHATDVTEQFAAKQRNKQIERKYQVVVESLKEGVVVLDQSGHLVSSNASACKILGLHLSQLIGRNPFDSHWHTIHEDGRSMDQTDHAPQRVLKTKQPLTNQIVGIPKTNGATAWLMLNAQPILDGTSLTGIVVSLFDITERKQTQEALEQELKVTATITNLASNGLMMIDAEGLVAYMNPSAETLTGFRLQDCLGLSIHALMHHSYPNGKPYPVEDCPVNSAYRNDRSVPIHEDLFFKRDGTPMPVLVSGKPIPGGDSARATVIEFRDITEEKQAVQSLAKSEAELRFLAESMPQKVFTADAEGNVSYFNQEWMNFTGLNFEAIRDWGWTQFIHPDDLDENVRVWKQSIKTGDLFKLEHRFRSANGDYHWHLSRARPMRDDDGKIIRWYGSSTDIDETRRTLQRKVELEQSTTLLKKQRTQLVELNNAKDDFIALASHQLRTPATAVKQYLGLLLDGFAGPTSDTQLTFLQTAYSSNERQLRIITDLLKTAQIDSNSYTLTKQRQTIHEIVAECITEMAPTLEMKNQTVQFEVADETTAVLIDKLEIKLVFINLIENASKYSYPDATIDVAIKRNKGKLEIKVADNGVGISAKDLGKIFDKFTRINNVLSDTVTGTGLGLYWVRRIVELHGGTINVKSEPGNGSVFTVRLQP